MRKKLGFLAAVMAISLALGCAHGSPTPVANQITWNDYTDPDGIGFYLYWDQTTPPGTYVDARKVDIGKPDPEIINVRTFLPNVRATTCFRMTAYDAAGNESQWSNEACGYFGFTNPTNVKVQ